MAVYPSLLATMPSFSRATGPVLLDGGDVTKLYGYTLGAQGGLTAGAGGTIAAAISLAYGFNRVTTVASGNDSTILPPAVPGSVVWVKNYAASNTLRIYANQANASHPDSSGNAQADNMVAKGATSVTTSTSAITLAAGHMTAFICTTLGLFDQVSDWS